MLANSGGIERLLRFGAFSSQIMSVISPIFSLSTLTCFATSSIFLFMPFVFGSFISFISTFAIALISFATSEIFKSTLSFGSYGSGDIVFASNLAGSSFISNFGFGGS